MEYYCRELSDFVCKKGRKMQKKLNRQDLKKVCTLSQFPGRNYTVIINVQIWRLKMRTNSANIGKTIQELRRARKISKADLSRMAGISVSHLEKIESGLRDPGMGTYQKFMEIMRLDIIIRNENETTQEKCVVRAQEILMKSTDKEALYLTKMLESMAENLNLVM